MDVVDESIRSLDTDGQGFAYHAAPSRLSIFENPFRSLLGGKPTSDIYFIKFLASLTSIHSLAFARFGRIIIVVVELGKGNRFPCIVFSLFRRFLWTDISVSRKLRIISVRFGQVESLSSFFLPLSSDNSKF